MSPTTKIVRVVGPDPPIVEGDEVVAGDRLDAGLGPRSGERNAIGMARSVEQRRQYAQREPLRLGLLLGDAGQQHRALALDVLRP